MPKVKYNRIDAVFIRKSSQEQDDSAQIANVKRELIEIGVTVPQDHWFAVTVSRAKVGSNSEFIRLMKLVEDGNVKAVYVESQDRWGTTTRPELFGIIGKLREHNTKLIDLKAKTDLTDESLPVEMMAVFASFKSEDELKKLSYRSIRSRVNNFAESGSFPTGTHPFGYGKACSNAEGTLLWEWDPISRSKGHIYIPNKKGKLVAGPRTVSLPRKSKRDKTLLVPSRNKDFIETIQLVFELYANVGLSRRQISFRLNQAGRRFYEKMFSHSLVGQILVNPAYAGDTHFGKTRSAKYYSFDQTGLMLEMPSRSQKTRKRAQADRIVKENTHTPLITRVVWNRTQEKLSSEQERVSYSPRNPDYYLKQILVCGHCGKAMAGRTETDSKTGRKTVLYICSPYVNGRSSGQDVECGYQRITHQAAESLLLEKISELGLNDKKDSSGGARDEICRRIKQLYAAEEDLSEERDNLIEQGVQALSNYLVQNHKIDDQTLSSLKTRAYHLYLCGHCIFFKKSKPVSQLPIAVNELKAAIKAAEAAAVEQVTLELERLNKTHLKLTTSWAMASELSQKVLRIELDRLEVEIGLLEPKTKKLSDRIAEVRMLDKVNEAERSKLLNEWPNLENREKGERLRRQLRSLTLFWKKEFHPSIPTPKQPRKTNRKGRFKYTLKKDQIQWGISALDSDGSS